MSPVPKLPSLPVPSLHIIESMKHMGINLDIPAVNDLCGCAIVDGVTCTKVAISSGAFWLGPGVLVRAHNGNGLSQVLRLIAHCTHTTEFLKGGWGMQTVAADAWHGPQNS